MKKTIKRLREMMNAITSDGWVVYQGSLPRYVSVLLKNEPREERVTGYSNWETRSRHVCTLSDDEYHNYEDENEEKATAMFIAESHNIMPTLLSICDKFENGDDEKLDELIEEITHFNATDEQIELLKRLKNAAQVYRNYDETDMIDKEIIIGGLKELIEILNSYGKDEEDMRKQMKEITDVLTPLAIKSLNLRRYENEI